MARTAAAILLPLSVVAGCADAYRASADADVYRLVNDRKAAALGYGPQSVSEPVGRPLTRPAEEADRVPRDVAGGKDPRSVAAESDPAAPPGPRAYANIPVTPIPPMEPPALELPSLAPPAGPLGPFLNDPSVPSASAATQPARLDPFATEMATRWADDPTAYGPAKPRPKPTQLDLFASLRHAVRHSRRYRDQMDALYLSALDVTLERHLLSPRPFVRGGLQYTGGQRASAYQSALTATMDAGVRQRLPYGGEVVAEALVDFVHALDGNVTDGETASVALSGSVPLLRGAGLVNLEALISSERQLVYQVRAFEDFRRQFAIEVANAYFRLLASYQRVNNRRINVANSVSLLDRTRAIYGASVGGGAGSGRSLRLTFLEVQRAEQQLLDAQNSLIDAQEGYLNELDNFKVLLGMDMRQEMDIVPVVLEVNVPDLETRDLTATALRYRLDLQTARDRVDDARRNVANAQNGLLPDLNLTARGAAGNPADGPAKSLNSRTLTYAAGVTLDLPVDRLAERNVYRRALIGFYQSQREYDDLQDRVAADVRSAVRAIRASQASLALQRRSIELAEARLENANLLLKRGDINARDIVEAQNALIRAQDSFEQARADLQVQVLQFLRQTGTLRVDPDAGTLGRALDRSAGPWRDAERPASQERAAPHERAASNTSPEPG